MSEFTTRLYARVDAWSTSLKDEEGSQALEAAGAALAAMAIVFLLREGAGTLGTQIRAAMVRAATALN
jgi:rhamnogalacturonyl hydrolase YesR